MIDAIGAVPTEAYMGRDLLCVFDHADTIRNLTPDMDKLLKLDGLLLQVTAPGETTDSISRSFAPKLNVTEDPVCGSGHCHIVPYWAEISWPIRLPDVAASSIAECPEIKYFWQERLPCFPNVNYIFR